MTMGIAGNVYIIIYTESKTIRKARRYTMSQFYTADPHFFHTSVAHERGFASGDAFVDHWCEQYEKQVRRDSDIVYIVMIFCDTCDDLWLL